MSRGIEGMKVEGIKKVRPTNRVSRRIKAKRMGHLIKEMTQLIPLLNDEQRLTKKRK